jgi:2-dehydropantoate 2-reductase
MKVLVVGAGVIGTVYGAHLAADGHQVSVLAHGLRTVEVAREGLAATDLVTGARTRARVRVLDQPGASAFDLVLISVRADQLAAAAASVHGLAGSPALLFFGNNPAGHAALPGDLPGFVHLGFPGIGGTMTGGGAEYVRIAQQPTTLEAGGPAAVTDFGSAMTRRGFAVTRTASMDGWLAYHAVFVGSIAAALLRCSGSAPALAADRPALTLMCRSVEEGFAALGHQGVRGLPGNLRWLHRPVLRPLAVHYWARVMRSPMGERCFAAHTRHAEPEMRSLGAAALRLAGGSTNIRHLHELLAATTGSGGQ